MTPTSALAFTRYLLKESTASFWADAELYIYLTEAEQEVMDLILEEDEGYFQTTNETIDYASGTQEYDLPADCVKVVLVERTDLDPVKTLHPINMQDKLKYEPALATGISDEDWEGYYLNGEKIGIVPTPDESQTDNLKIYYIKENPDVASGSAAFTVPNRYSAHQLVCVKGAILAKLKGDEPIGDLERREARLEAKLKTSLVSRQTQEPRYVNYIDS